MIKANELRIGNLLIHGGYDIVIKVTSIFNSHFRCTGVLNGIDYEDSIRRNYQPIPLTPEILEKAGFEKSPTNGFYVNNAIWLEAIPFVTPIYCDGTGFRRYIGKQIEYLHQLQNLHFSLSGEELDIKP